MRSTAATGWSVGLVQIVLAVATALLVYEIARRWLSPRVAVGAAIVATLNPYLIWHDVHVNREIVDQLLAAALVLVTLAVAERTTLVRAGALGALCGLAILGNSRLVLLPLVLLAYLAWRLGGSRRLVVTGVTLLAATGLVLAPWVVRNEVSVGCAAITTDARALWKANNVATDQVLESGRWIDAVPRFPGDPPTPEDAGVVYRETGRVIELDECEQMRAYQERTIDFWREHPGEKAELAARGAGMLWDPRVTRNEENPGAGDLDGRAPGPARRRRLRDSLRRRARRTAVRAALVLGAGGGPPRLPDPLRDALRRRDAVPRALGLPDRAPGRLGRPASPRPAAPLMRVAHVHRISGIGGSERHLLALLPALRLHGIEPSFVGLDDPAGAPEPFYAALGEAGIPFARVHSRHDLDPRLPFRIARAARPFRPELVHTHLVHADVHGAAAATLLRLPLVSTKHNDDPFRAGPFRYVERLLARRARRIITITESLARFNEERVGIPRAKLVVVHYGLDQVPPRWGDNPPLTVPEGARILLALGRLVPQKGLDVAVRALPVVHETHPDAVLVVAGEGPERQALEELAAGLGVGDGLFLLGRAGDVAALLERAELLIHPSRWEGFGLVLLEAMLASRPVVATRVSSIPEIVVDGETGVLVPPDDAQALAGALVRVLGDPGSLGAAGRARALEQFSADAMARKTAAVYSDAIRTTASAHDSAV